MIKLLGGQRPKSLITSSLVKAHKVLSMPCNRSEGELEDIQHLAGLNSVGLFLLNSQQHLE